VWRHIGQGSPSPPEHLGEAVNDIAGGFETAASRTAADPQLTAGQLARFAVYGVVQEVRAGDIVFRPGDPAYDLIVIETGQIEIVSPPSSDEPEAVVARYRSGGFLGELNLLTGQTVYLTARVIEPGRIHRIAPEQFRRLMAEDPELSDILLRTFLARRDLLRGSSAAHGIEIIGSSISGEALALRTYAARQRLPHLWLDADSVAGRTLMRSMPLTIQDLPVVVTPDQVLRPAQLARTLGLSYGRKSTKPVDLTVIGCGPAGLAAAVCGASEGLDTVVLDVTGIGGQAAASSRIENYVGFPNGISGHDLTQRAALQAMKFGAQLSSPCEVIALDTAGEHLRVVLADGTDIDTRSALIATGARYRTLPLPRWAEFVGAGIYYAATELEAQACNNEPVIVIGGANSAGQAALYLASRGSDVTLVLRGPAIETDMSSYLADRLKAHARVSIRASTEVTTLIGTTRLEAVTLDGASASYTVEQSCRGLFCFIGAEPSTAWAHGVILDANGFIRTDTNLDGPALGPVWTALGRDPLPFETSIPAVFAAGDVRVGAMKRVAAAVGEGASAVRSVHAAIGIRA
jgi:thioredoxin reductase (NADPH)